MEENKTLIDNVKEQVETGMQQIVDQQVQESNVEYLYKLMDIHKDIEQEKYWERKEENMNKGYGYGYGYGAEDYGRRGGYSEGNYSEGNYSEGSYGRRGVPGSGRRRYRGEEMLNDIHEEYGNYMASGSYGGEETMKALKYMLKSAEEFFKHIQEEAKSPEEIEMVKETAKKIAMM